MIADTPRAGDKITEKGVPLSQFQALLEAYELAINEPRLPSFTVATAPDVSETRMIYVSDEVGGATIAFSDGVSWFRVQDRVIIS